MGPSAPFISQEITTEFQFLSRNSVRWDHSIIDGISAINHRFQFLSRNSVRWDARRCSQRVNRHAVSIPQSEFCPLGRLPAGRGSLLLFDVSIPQSEFCPLGLAQSLVETGAPPRFQFLSRNSVRWDFVPPDFWAAIGPVSIPQSEFCPLGHLRRSSTIVVSRRFNSSVGILSVGTPAPDSPDVHNTPGFNSSVGILSVGTRPGHLGFW